MSKNRLFYILITVAILGVVGLTIREALATSKVALAKEGQETKVSQRALDAYAARWVALGERYEKQQDMEIERLLSQADNNIPASVKKDLAAIRQLTTKYKNIDNAIADGFVPTTACVAVPGVGGMGFHYVNPERAMDPKIDLAQPEILLYASTSGELKLVGVEYFQGIGAPDSPIPDPAPDAPVLFGRSFDGPMTGHEPGMPPHYDLHVWVWLANPDGVFAPLNPNITCP